MLKETPQRTVIVIGAGVTGLTTAHALKKRGHRVLVLEKSDRPGGSIRTSRHDGWLVEAGPNTMLVNEQALLDFFNEIGLAGELIEASTEAKKRYIVRGGRPVAAPMGPGEFIKTPLFSAGAKWRLLCEPFIRRARPDAEESIAQFARRRLGAEVVDYAINPLIGGIFAGDPEQLSIRHAFPTLYRFDREHGSLLRGAIASARARKREGRTRFKSRSISFRNGLQALIDALVHEVGDSLETRATITAIEPGSPWRVRYSGKEGSEEVVEADAVIVTIPAHAAARLPFPAACDNPLGGLAAIDYPPVTSLSLGFSRDQVEHPLDGYGALVPAKEGFQILGTLFSSSLFAGRAPEGHVLLTTFVGGKRQPEHARLPEDELQRIVLADLRKLFGVRGEPVFARRTAWERAIPQYALGYDEFHRVMDRAEERLPGLIMGGHIRDGVSVGDCLRAGWKLAARID